MDAPRYRPSGIPAGYTVEDVVDEAVAYIEAEGFETLTMRKLATALRVTPMTIYRHVANKHDLLSLVADRYFDGLRVDADSGDWRRYLQEWFLALHDLMLEHPVLAHVMAEQPLDGPVAWKVADHVIGVLAGHGFEPKAAGDLFTTLLTFTIGFTLVRRARLPGGGDAMATRPTEQLRADYPHLASGLSHYAYWLGTSSFQRSVRTFVEGWAI